MRDACLRFCFAQPENLVTVNLVPTPVAELLVNALLVLSQPRLRLQQRDKRVQDVVFFDETGQDAQRQLILRFEQKSNDGET